MKEDAPEEPIGPSPGPSGTSSILRRVARLSAFNVVAYVITAGSGLAINVIVARHLGPANFGRYSFFIWIVRTTVWLLALGIPPALVRLLSEYEGSGDTSGARGIYQASIKYQTFLMPLMFGATWLWVAWKSDDRALAWVLASAAVLLTYVWLFEQTLGGLRRYDLVARNAAVVAAAQLAALAVIVIRGGDLKAFLVLYLAISVVTFFIWGVVTHRLLGKWPIREVDRGARKTMLRLAGTMAVIQVSDNVLWGRPEVFFLEASWGAHQVGLYSAALVLQTLTVYLPHIASRVLTPEFAWLRGGGKHDDLVRAFPEVCRYIAVFAIPLGIGGAVMAGSLLEAAYGSEFLGGVVPAMILMSGGALIAIAGPASSATYTGPKPGFMARLAAGGAALNIALDMMLIPTFGPTGAAVATISSQCLAVLISIGYVRVKMGLHYPWADIAKVAVAALVATVAMRLALKGFAPIPRLLLLIPSSAAIYMWLVARMGVIDWKGSVAALRRRAGDGDLAS